MGKTSREVKTRHLQKKHDESEEIECACGCGQKLKRISPSGRPRRYILGHHTRKYEDRKQYKREWIKRNKDYMRRKKMRRHQRLRVKLITERGGVCEDCRTVVYNGKNGAVFHFHHLDPLTKEFNLANQLNNLAWSKIQLEASKCIMLCANCHELRHSEPY